MTGPDTEDNRYSIMKTQFTTSLLAATLLAVTAPALAESDRDCMLEGTVYKTERGGEEQMQVKFHSIERYDEDARCRTRRGEKMEFKLPQDTRLQEAPDGANVKYRYQEKSDGSSSTELISVGTSA